MSKRVVMYMCEYCGYKNADKKICDKHEDICRQNPDNDFGKVSIGNTETNDRFFRPPTKWENDE